MAGQAKYQTFPATVGATTKTSPQTRVTGRHLARVPLRRFKDGATQSEKCQLELRPVTVMRPDRGEVGATPRLHQRALDGGVGDVCVCVYGGGYQVWPAGATHSLSCFYHAAGHNEHQRMHVIAYVHYSPPRRQWPWTKTCGRGKNHKEPTNYA